MSIDHYKVSIVTSGADSLSCSPRHDAEREEHHREIHLDQTPIYASRWNQTILQKRMLNKYLPAISYTIQFNVNITQKNKEQSTTVCRLPISSICKIIHVTQRHFIKKVIGHKSYHTKLIHNSRQTKLTNTLPCFIVHIFIFYVL